MCPMAAEEKKCSPEIGPRAKLSAYRQAWCAYADASLGASIWLRQIKGLAGCGRDGSARGRYSARRRGRDE
nr:hypothetical protein SHINE37_10038 [Rhizobiaceae bacterium]